MITISKLQSIIELAEKATVYDRVEEMSGELPVQYFLTSDYVKAANPKFVKELAMACLEMKEVLEVFSEQENYFHDYYLFKEDINKEAKEVLEKWFVAE